MSQLVDVTSICKTMPSGGDFLEGGEIFRIFSSESVCPKIWGVWMKGPRSFGKEGFVLGGDFLDP